MKPLTEDKVYRKKFIGDELTWAMNGFFNTVSMNENSITSMLVEAIRPAKVGTDVIYLTPPDKDKKKVHLCTVYLFENTIKAFEKLEEKGKLVKTSDVKSALKLLNVEIHKHIKRNHYNEAMTTHFEIIYELIDKCFPALKVEDNLIEEAKESIKKTKEITEETKRTMKKCKHCGDKISLYRYIFYHTCDLCELAKFQLWCDEVNEKEKIKEKEIARRVDLIKKPKARRNENGICKKN